MEMTISKELAIKLEAILINRVFELKNAIKQSDWYSPLKKELGHYQGMLDELRKGIYDGNSM